VNNAEAFSSIVFGLVTVGIVKLDAFFVGPYWSMSEIITFCQGTA